VRRNETRELSLMSLLRVNSGTANKKITLSLRSLAGAVDEIADVASAIRHRAKTG
jgi:hypothetical protein